MDQPQHPPAAATTSEITFAGTRGEYGSFSNFSAYPFELDRV